MSFQNHFDELFGSFFDFESLPAEVRNEIYEFYIPERPVSINRQIHAVALRINKHGELVAPALTSVSRQIRCETRGYIHNAINNNGLIHAQIKDYDTRPLYARLDLLSKEFSMPMCMLLDRVVITLLGELNIHNIIDWVINHLRCPRSYPFFPVADTKILPKLNSFGEVSLLTGQISLPPIIRSLLVLRNQDWDKAGWRFIERMQDLINDKFYKIDYLASKDDEALDLPTRIVNLYVAGHTLLEHHKDELQLLDNRLHDLMRVKTMRSKLFAMAEIMSQFQWELERLG